MSSFQKIFNKFGPIGYVNCNNTKVSYTSSNPSGLIGWSRTDTVKRVKPDGLDLLFNPTSVSTMSYWKRDSVIWVPTTCTSGVFKGKQVLTPVSVNDRYGMNYPNHRLALDTARITNRLLAKIKDQRVNIAMALAQYRETAGLFNDLAGKLVQAYNCARSLKKMSAKGCKKRTPWLKNRSGEFLAYSYGVVPLVNDMVGSLSLLDNALERGIVQVFKTGYKDSLKTPVSYGTQYRPELLEDHETHDISVTARCYVEWDNSMLATASSLGLTNPLFVIWDTIPYSHVVDWFIGVGQYLNGLDAMTGVKRYSATCSVRNISRVRRVSKYGGNSSAQRKTVSRSVLSLSAPVLTTGPGLNGFRGLQALAMLRQRLR